MYVVIFNWRALPLVLGAFAAGVASSLLAFTLSWHDGTVFAGLATAGLTLLAVDYFLYRRRDLMGMPMWRLLDPAAGGHVFFVPCWVWGGVAIFFSSVALGVGGDKADQTSSSPLSIALGLVGLLLPPVLDFIRPFNRFRWAARDREEDDAITPQ